MLNSFNQWWDNLDEDIQLELSGNLICLKCGCYINIARWVYYGFCPSCGTTAKKYNNNKEETMWELKIRAWDIEEKRMRKVEVLTYWKGRATVWRFWDEANELPKNPYNPERFILMRYIGHKDIKKNEIYEEDIIRWYPNRPKNHRDEIVEWDESRLCFILGGWYENDFPDTEKYCKIIGNIYDDPELVKKIKKGENNVKF